MSTSRRNIRRTLAETPDELIDVSVTKPLPRAEPDGNGVEQPRTVLSPPVELAPGPRNNMDYRDIALDSERISNPMIERLRQDAHALTKTGLVDAEKLEGLSLRVLEFNDGTSRAYERDALGKQHEPVMAIFEAREGRTMSSSHYIASTVHAITINGQEAEGMFPKGGATPEEALQAVYLHELGHATHSSEDVRDRLLGVSKADTTSELPSDVRESLIRMVGNDFQSKYFRAHDGSSLDTVASEMHADAFMLASIQQLKGEEAAIAIANAWIHTREKGHTEGLNDMGPEGTLVVGHNTTHALRAFEDLRAKGEVSSVTQGDGLIEVVDKATYTAYFQEVSEKMLANLNAHHLNEQGVPTPGLPEGVSRGEVVTALARGELQSPGSGFTLFMEKGLRSELEKDGITLHAGGTRANPDIEGKVDFKSSIAAVPGFEALTTSSDSLTVRDNAAGAATTYRFGSAVENYLESKGLVAGLPLLVEKNNDVKEAYYGSLRSNMEELGPEVTDLHDKLLGSPPRTESFYAEQYRAQHPDAFEAPVGEFSSDFESPFGVPGGFGGFGVPETSSDEPMLSGEASESADDERDNSTTKVEDLGHFDSKLAQDKHKTREAHAEAAVEMELGD